MSSGRNRSLVNQHLPVLLHTLKEFNYLYPLTMSWVLCFNNRSLFSTAFQTFASCSIRLISPDGEHISRQLGPTATIQSRQSWYYFKRNCVSKMTLWTITFYVWKNAQSILSVTAALSAWLSMCIIFYHKRHLAIFDIFRTTVFAVRLPASKRMTQCQGASSCYNVFSCMVHGSLFTPSKVRPTRVFSSL